MCLLLRGDMSYRGRELLINKYALNCGRCGHDSHLDIYKALPSLELVPPLHLKHVQIVVLILLN